MMPGGARKNFDRVKFRNPKPGHRRRPVQERGDSTKPIARTAQAKRIPDLRYVRLR
jgi:hypothetical protein